MSEKVVTRFPPSPTGYLHIGSARTALFNYLFAKHNRGEMRLRFEDTDKERNKKEYEDDILEGLRWLGIAPEAANIPRQSERIDLYKKHLVPLIEKGLAYEGEESTNSPGKKVIRFKNSNKKITFFDIVRGEVTFDTTELGDFVIARSLDEPLYHLAVVIDDHEMGVTHIIRGEDHISNTQRQILLLEALGFARPEYGHIPLILAPDKTKLSKRHGAISITDYRAQGFVPEAMVNYLALLGWNPGGDREIFTLSELVENFTMDRVHKSSAIFDVTKLRWFNHEHLKKVPDIEYAVRLNIDLKLVPLLKERAQTLVEAKNMIAGELNFLNEISYEPALLTKGAKTDGAGAKKHLLAVKEMLQKLSNEDFTGDTIKKAIFPYATKEGRAAVLWPLRVALSGKEKSPDPFVLASILGKEKTLRRIEEALKML